MVIRRALSSALVLTVLIWSVHLAAQSSGPAALSASAPAASPASGSGAVRAGPVGYLQPGTMPDVMRVLPPPPLESDVRDAADLAVFRSTRRFEGSARWAIAQRDNTLGTVAMLKAFSCAMDASIVSEAAPAL